MFNIHTFLSIILIANTSIAQVTTCLFFLLQAKMCDIKAYHQPLRNEQIDLIIFVKIERGQLLISFLVIYSGRKVLISNTNVCIT